MTTSERVCKHMNEDHADSLLAFAWHYAQQPSASSATLVRIDREGFDLACTVREAKISARVPFVPVLKTDGEMRSRLVAMHSKALQPRLRYLLPPLASLPLALMVILALAIFQPDVAALQPVRDLGVKLLGSTTRMGYLLGAAVVVHVIEATLAGHCALELKLPRHIALGWAGLTFLGGNGTLRLLHEIRAQRGSGNKPNDKSH